MEDNFKLCVLTVKLQLKSIMNQELKTEVSQEIKTEITQMRSKEMREMKRGTTKDNQRKQKPKIIVISAAFLSDFK